MAQTVKALQQIKGFKEEDLPVPDHDTQETVGAQPTTAAAALRLQPLK